MMHLTLAETVLAYLLAPMLLVLAVFHGFHVYIRERSRLARRAAFQLALKVWRMEVDLGYEQLSEVHGWEAPDRRQLHLISCEADYHRIPAPQVHRASINPKGLPYRPGPSAYDHMTAVWTDDEPDPVAYIGRANRPDITS